MVQMRTRHQPALSQRPSGAPGFLLSDGLGGAGYGLGGWAPGLHPAHPGYVVCLPGLSRGVVKTIQKTLSSRQEGLSTWAEAMSFRWQGSKAEPSSPRGPPTAPPQSQPRKGHRHKKLLPHY